MNPLVVLITDQIYTKTLRYLQKIRMCVGSQASIYLACVSGFSNGLDIQFVRDLVPEERVILGSVEYLADRVRYLTDDFGILKWLTSAV